ncbi:MAG TPA: ABC transporter ATP-binding protein [Streptosporangiaceae bacterium]|nr:ABC transporter ATP-binding protein [Streptosporangiaceae bacterium]
MHATSAAGAARVENLVKRYGTGHAAVTALDGVSLSVAAGSFVAVMGPSGSGKSTLMHCMAGLDTPDSGSVWIGDQEITSMRDRQLTTLRRDRVGFIFQAFNLLPALSAAGNITLPADIAGRKPDKEWLATVVATVGLADRLTHRPSELSGGQQQRVAIARALAGRPAIIFADEPTGNLDSRASAEVLDLLRRCVADFGQAVVMVTHDPVAASYSQRVVFLADGRPVGTLERPTPDDVLDRMRSLGETSPPSAGVRRDPAGR